MTPVIAKYEPRPVKESVVSEYTDSREAKNAHHEQPEASRHPS